MKKLGLATLLALGISSTAFGTGISAETSHDPLTPVDGSNKLDPTVGAELVKTTTSEDGIQIDLYNQNTPERKAMLRATKSERLAESYKTNKETSSEPSKQLTTLSSGWDLVDTQWMYFTISDVSRSFGSVYSTGGDFAFDIPAHRVGSSTGSPELWLIMEDERGKAANRLPQDPVTDENWLLVLRDVQPGNIDVHYRNNYTLKYQGGALKASFYD
ncbi:hypothetical protein GLV98_10365 [Halobacillus litoralis]|uniref:Uncharacterized protein n=1 Tax=Halobacillus litoralis TaxID=45668 RepID=A0A845E4Z4_9BACI|nr:hypothetical protein [Halobacillus litoralis]MYL49892.1 hypothetical protein [Halobacillus litoralis]